MIIIPMQVKVPTCPTCGREIQDSGPPLKWWEWIVIFAIMLAICAVVIWCFFTVMTWLFPLRGHPTLVEVLAGQWEWLTSLRVW